MDFETASTIHPGMRVLYYDQIYKVTKTRLVNEPEQRFTEGGEEYVWPALNFYLFDLQGIRERKEVKHTKIRAEECKECAQLPTAPRAEIRTRIDPEDELPRHALVAGDHASFDVVSPDGTYLFQINLFLNAEGAHPIIDIIVPEDRSYPNSHLLTFAGKGEKLRRTRVAADPETHTYSIDLAEV